MAGDVLPYQKYPRFSMESVITGRAYVLADNIDTDQIIPAQWLKLSTTDPEERKLYGTYCMSSVPEGQRGLPKGNVPFIREGGYQSDYTIVVGGKNFGSGSSREQAATAIKFFGIPLVLAATFSQTYKRNAFNNGFPLLECPELVALLRASFGAKPPTIRTGWNAEIDFRASTLTLNGPNVAGRKFSFLPLGPVAQQLVVAGGAEAWVAHALAAGGSA